MISDVTTFTSKEIGGLTTWVVEDGGWATPDEACRWLGNHAPAILNSLHRHGALRITGMRRIRTAEQFSNAVMRVTPNLRGYVGGTSPRTQAFEKIMTATYTPPNWSIILHQEMAYTNSMPDYISFFCENPASSGGESTFGSMAEALDQIDPAVRDRLDRQGLRLCRTLLSPENVHLKPGVKKPWTEVFDTEDRERVAEIVAAKGWTHEWMANDTLRLCQELVPAVRQHPVTGRSVWCNQAHFFPPVCMMAWAREDGRNEDLAELAHAVEKNPQMLDNIYLGNGGPISDEDALHVYGVLRQIERSVRLTTSDLLLVDNFLVSHGRKAFDGDRRVLVALADRE
jgi:alpha-ketoglutarate-dependent taurine dioxygenase